MGSWVLDSAVDYGMRSTFGGDDTSVNYLIRVWYGGGVEPPDNECLFLTSPGTHLTFPSD